MTATRTRTFAVLGMLIVSLTWAAAMVCVAAPAGAVGAVAVVHRDATTPDLTEDESSFRMVFDDHPEIEEVWTYSPSMNRDIPLLVLPASVPNAPTLYLLNGVDGGVETNHWFGKGKAAELLADKGVNVVVPVDGANSYYTDWLSPSALDRPDRGGLTQQWATYLTEELPGPLEESLGANGTRAIVGMSMSATSALQLVEDNPGFYSAAAGLSGCYDTTSDQGRGMVDQVVAYPDTGATGEQMWGPVDGDYAQAHDPLNRVADLRAEVQGSQIPLYFSAANAVPNDEEATALPEMGDPTEMTLSYSAGAALEAGSLHCTQQLEQALTAEGVPATIDYLPRGLHSWATFPVSLEAAWPTLARGLFG
ncbi:alpha/beta hydrolase [Corynebacterium terpenotabidum]|uniref:Esterase n=1 Tax=Corynebacterium terpenotabidum Y-11 TaxID=1200352 RepID=S4XIW2_9CORY|nr:alpha/beta hydrolase family protein [Corynebacterium terpenotabidum]AGP31695.1 hypothetical protein A606_10280 [Corynebacterium terpenotabidum Y-11]